MSNLADVTTPELLAELGARCHAVIVAFVYTDSGNKRTCKYGAWGDELTCIGLAERLREHIHAEENDDSECEE